MGGRTVAFIQRSWNGTHFFGGIEFVDRISMGDFEGFFFENNQCMTFGLVNIMTPVMSLCMFTFHFFVKLIEVETWFVLKSSMCKQNINIFQDDKTYLNLDAVDSGFSNFGTQINRRLQVNLQPSWWYLDSCTANGWLEGASDITYQSCYEHLQTNRHTIRYSKVKRAK